MQQPRFLKWSLIFAIAIVANLFINYALSLAYKSPKYEQFCPSQQVIEPVTSQAQCLSVGGQWNGNDYRAAAPQGNYSGLSFADKITPVAVPGYCNTTFTCSQQYDDARQAYERNVFVTLVAFGVLLIVLSLLSLGNAVVKTSLSFAGSLSLVVASVRYWGEAQDWLKVVILGVALVALIWLAVKKFSERKTQ